MTIKQFALLCGCNPQTLRYYDHVNLLKPVKVDQWSGYRYYDEEQALEYVKIKNLQAAGFAIDEIRKLLDKDNFAIYNALDAKITEQETRLQEIKTIRQSYLAEMSEIQRKIQETKESILKVMREYDSAEEFGLNQEQYADMLGNVHRFFDNIAETDPAGFDAKFDWDEFHKNDEPKEEDEYLKLLKNPEYKLVYEKHDWNFVKDFIDECCDLEDGAEYALLIRITKEKEITSMAFANTILGVMLARNPEKQKSLSCNVELSEDNHNHFWLLKHKA